MDQAAIYHDTTPVSFRESDLLGDLLDRWATGKVLDVGCADGRHLAFLDGRERHGIDLSEKRVEQARARLPDADIRQGSVFHLPYGNATFDATYSIATLVLTGSTRAAVGQLARVTKPGGIVLVDIANRWHLATPRWRAHYAREGVPTSFVSHAEALRVFDRFGLEVLEEHGSGAVTHLSAVPVVGRLPWGEVEGGGLDRRLSSRVLRGLAARWYFVCRKL